MYIVVTSMSAGKNLEKLFSKSLDYHEELGIILGYKFYDHRSISERRPSDFIVSSKNHVHLVECKEVTSRKNFFYEFDRTSESGQDDSLYRFANFFDHHQSWILINYNNRRSGRSRVDKYFIINIEDLNPVKKWIEKKSIRFDELEYYNRFIHPKKYENLEVKSNLLSVKYFYNMEIKKMSVDGLKRKLLNLESSFN
jgi:hypothetical protein